MTPVSDTQAMIAGMTPVLDPGLYVFRSATDISPSDMDTAFAIIREAEGMTVIAPVGADDAAADLQMRRITLTVFSALDGIGLTAAVADALTQARIPCNVVAAFHHDHVFVPAHQAQAALEALKALQATAT